ncbi:hypothetical protein F4818DRAFT_384712 [Hypoxylon cercidicola]|nr:hypothetical protein F4818DRAFT_384712 [Hypoxylon cercidicola]
MRSYTSIALLGLASTTLATFSPQALKNIRDLTREHVVVEVREVVARSPQDQADATACASSALALLTDIPLPSDTGLVSFLATATETDECKLSSDVPQSLLSAFNSYDQAASSWLSAHSSEIQVFATACQDDADVASVNSVISGFASNTAGCSPSTASVASTASAASVASTTSSGLAARPTGVLAGVVAAAGLLGAAVAL